MDMTTATSKNGNALAAYSGNSNPWASAGDDLGAQGGIFMKFNGNTGDFTAGQDQDDVPHGTQLAALMDGFARGYICWKNSEVVDEIMVPVLEGKPPHEGDLEDHGPYEKYDDGTEDGWSEQAKLVFRSVATGEDLTFKTTSKSGLRALGALSKDYGRLFRSHPDEYPIIEVGATEFTPKNNKKIGKKYAPSFRIVGWKSREEVDALADGAGSGEDDASNYAQNETAQVTDQRAAEPAPAEKAPVETAPAERRTVQPQQPAGEAQGRRAKRF
jgi:hypothetical protein